MATSAPAGVPDAGAEPAAMTNRQILKALSGLLLGMFVAILSSTVVTNALPTIVRDLHGSQSSYTWVVTATLLATTATTTLWGKLSDLFSKKLLIQLGLIIFVIGSAVAGAAQNPAMLITARVVQGVGAGGLTALTQVILASMIPPRRRGKYSGFLGATFAMGTICGPLIGGVIVDTSWLGWRWCFYVGVPFAIIALIVLQKTLHLPVLKREVKIDWGGAGLITGAVSALLIWVSMAGTGSGKHWDWVSWESAVFVGGAIVLLLSFILNEFKVREPIIPMQLFGIRTLSLSAFASMMVGVAMFSGTVYLSQYFQLAKGESPTMAGIMTLPMILGLFLSSTTAGQFISRTGRWKYWLVSGGLLITAGAALLSTVRYDTNYWIMAIFMFMLGAGVGMTMQNLVLAVQNQVPQHKLGAASSVISFTRSLGGAIGVSALGALMSNQVVSYMKDGLAEHHLKTPGGGAAGSSIPDVNKLPEPLATVVQSAYGHGIADLFLYAAPFAFCGLIAILFIREVPLRTKLDNQTEPPDDNTVELVPSDDAALPADQPSHGPARHAAPHHTHASPQEQPVMVGAFSDSPDANSGTQTQHANGQLSPSAAQAAQLNGVAEQAAPAQGPQVRGYVRGHEGAPVARATLTLIDLGGRQLGRANTGPNGWFRLDAPSNGSFVLIAAADGFQPQADTVVLGDESFDHDVALTGTSGLTGSVRSAEDGSPIQNATVVVTDVRGEVLATGKTSEEGRYHFGELVAGTFTLAVSATGHRPTALPIEVGGTGTTRCDVDLRSGAKLAGTVLAGPKEGPLNDARVTLVDSAGNVVGVTTTGEDGEYGFADLDAGEYTVIASGYPPAATALSVSGEGHENFELKLGHPDV